MRGLVLLLSLTTLLAACRGPAPSSSARTSGADATEIAVELPDDPAVGPADVVVRLAAGGEPVRGAEVEVTGDMTHAGMVPVIAAAEEVEPGVYRTEGFAFDMAGDWVLTVEATLPDGRRERAEAATTVRRP